MSDSPGSPFLPGSRTLGSGCCVSFQGLQTAFCLFAAVACDLAFLVSLAGTLGLRKPAFYIWAIQTKQSPSLLPSHAAVLVFGVLRHSGGFTGYSHWPSQLLSSRRGKETLREQGVSGPAMFTQFARGPSLALPLTSRHQRDAVYYTHCRQGPQHTAWLFSNTSSAFHWTKCAESCSDHAG